MSNKLIELEKCFDFIDDVYRTKNINICEGCRYSHTATCGNCTERLEDCKKQIEIYKRSK